MPGHMFPLRAHPSGLKERQGHTEGSIKLCELAGFKPVAVISEITSEDKIKMGNKEELEKLAKEHSLHH
jgi:3,4-dihydroxy-2-butanone 4-phosphate synthase